MEGLAELVGQKAGLAGQTEGEAAAVVEVPFRAQTDSSQS